MILSRIRRNELVELVNELVDVMPSLEKQIRICVLASASLPHSYVIENPFVTKVALSLLLIQRRIQTKKL